MNKMLETKKQKTTEDIRINNINNLHVNDLK